MSTGDVGAMVAYAVIDLQTTGLEPSMQHRVVEIDIVQMNADGCATDAYKLPMPSETVMGRSLVDAMKGSVRMEESYEFEFPCVYDWANPDEEPDVQETTISISVGLEPGDERKYSVDIYVNDTSGYDWQSIDYDMFEQVEGKMLSALAADGITESMLIYP